MADLVEPLECPACGGTNLHHEAVSVWNREEDSVEGLCVRIKGESVETLTSMKGNPSERRSGLSVWFWCEHCSIKSRLDLVQHKGSTYLKLVKDLYRG